MGRAGSCGSAGSAGKAGSEGIGNGITSAGNGSDGNLGNPGSCGSAGSDGKAGSDGIGNGITNCGRGSEGIRQIQAMAHVPSYFKVTDLDIAGCIGDDSGIGTGIGGPDGPSAVG